MTTATRRSGLVVVLAGSMLVDCLEMAALLVAAPAIAHGLGLTLFDVRWVLAGFALGFVIGLLAGPSATARWERRPVFLAALAVYVVAAVTGSVTDSATVLVGAEIVKGCCAALTAPAGLSLIAAAFDGQRRQRAVLTYSLVGAAGSTAGLVLSGLASTVSWRITLLVPAFAALLLLALAARTLPAESPPPVPPRFAVLGDPVLLRSALGAATLNGSFLGLLLLVNFQLQQEYGWTPWQAALVCLPTTVPLVLGLPFAQPVVRRFGTTRLIAAGAVLALTGYIWYLVRFEPSAMLVTAALIGLAFVLSFAPLNIQAGSVTGGAPLFQTAVQLGAVVVLPVVGALEMRTALVVVVCVGAAGVLVALAGLRAVAA
ncbi:MFS transporter [Lentzea sp. NPDC054927]